MRDIVENGQMRNGIVTANGIIIDGNRRASLLNRAYRDREQYGWNLNDVDKCQYFKAIVLPQNAVEKDIQQLETMYQMGEDDKLDYNPIEKYLKCQDLRDVGFEEDEIAKMMNESKTDVIKMLSTLQLMKDYLNVYGYDEMYPMLEHAEDQFLTLNKALKDWQSRGALAKRCNWDYTDADIDDLKLICFDYIRSDQEGKEFRRICKPGIDGALFQDENIWETFRDDHFETLGAIETESDVDDVLNQHSNLDAIEVLKGRDNAWKGQIADRFKRNLKYSVRKLDDRLDDARPKEILEKAKNLLDSIDVEQDGFYDDPDVARLVADINRITYNFKKILRQ